MLQLAIISISMNWMISKCVNKLFGLHLIDENAVHSCEQGKLILHILAFQHEIHFCCCFWALRFLT